MPDTSWYMEAIGAISEPPKDKPLIDYNSEYTARFIEAKTQAEAKGLRYEHPTQAGIGWKIHLTVSDNPQDELTKRVAAFIDGRRFLYKVGHGGTQEDGKGMTIYVGDRDTTEDLAKQITDTFGDEIPQPRGDVLGDDLLVMGRIMARFENTKDSRINKIKQTTVNGMGTSTDPKYVQYGPRGVPFLYVDASNTTWGGLSKDDARQNSIAALTEDYGAFFTGTRNHPI
jgi:hypothetical protein